MPERHTHALAGLVLEIQGPGMVIRELLAPFPLFVPLNTKPASSALRLVLMEQTFPLPVPPERGALEQRIRDLQRQAPLAIALAPGHYTEALFPCEPLCHQEFNLDWRGTSHPVLPPVWLRCGGGERRCRGSLECTLVR
jgi:hypothetical protein